MNKALGLDKFAEGVSSSADTMGGKKFSYTSVEAATSLKKIFNNPLKIYVTPDQ